MDTESLSATLTKMVPAQCPPGEGLIVFVKGGSQDALRKVALHVASNHPTGSVPVYVVPGRMVGEHAWPFSRIRKGERIRVRPNGDMVMETGGTIFPDSGPIVLLAEDFDYFDPNDQLAYCHLLDGEGHLSGGYSLAQASILICGISDHQAVDSSAMSRGYAFFD